MDARLDVWEGIADLTNYTTAVGIPKTAETSQTSIPASTLAAAHHTPAPAKTSTAKYGQAKAEIEQEASNATTSLTPLLEAGQLNQYIEQLSSLTPEIIAELYQRGTPHTDEVLIRTYQEALWKRAHAVHSSRPMES